MRVLSLFSGAGGLDLGLERAGMTVAGLCEIDKTARQVLANHRPGVPCHDDVTTLDGKEWRGRVDVVAGGSPCTDLSVAGRRAGLGGDESRLFWHQCRVAAESAAHWVVWENVYGALSSNGGRDFAAVLWGLTGFMPAVPADGWRTVGMCVGPDRTAVWRVFDAQWFGVAQRRRRVFVVAGPAGECGPEVLLEPESVPRGPRPSRPAGSIVAALTSCGVGTCGADDNQAQAGHLVVESVTYRPIEVAPTLDKSAGDGPRRNQAAPIVVDLAQVTSGTAVRRLTPVECERLMGWPDDHTRRYANGREIADSHRYRMCGNGVVSPVAEWIGSRIVAAHQSARDLQEGPQ